MKFPRFVSPGRRIPLSLAVALALSACANLPAPVPSTTAPATAAAATVIAAPGAATAPGASASAAARPPGATAPAGAGPSAGTPPAPQPFATVIRDAMHLPGLIALWQKDDKVWLELKPEDFGKPFLFSPKLAQGIGESRMFGGSMLRVQLVEFRRIHNQIQLIARNQGYTAKPGTPESHAVAAAFSPSLLSSATVASQPHPERKTVLVDAGPLFLGDVLAIGNSLQRAYRQQYALDARNTGFTSVRSQDDQVVFNVQAHFATANLAVPPPSSPGAPSTAPSPTTPKTLPDPRSMFFGLYYSLAKLPDDVMRPRVADARVGYFTTTVQDFSDDFARSPRQRHVNRWRLEKKDPAAAMSEPVKPITFWLDKTMPHKYRGAITDGILAWNEAFERIGFKNAIIVKVQPADAKFDTLDVGVASVRWMTNASPSFGATGPSHVDPRSGEILDADIAFESLSSRSLRTIRSQILASSIGNDWPALMQAPSGAHVHGEQCDHADHAAEQMTYALDVLAARGDILPDGTEAEQFVLGYLKDVSMHEVGHTLGLRHNFRSSRAFSLAQLGDAAFTVKNGVAGSVMDYSALNLPPPGVPMNRHGHVHAAALGPYDFWAIEYAYRPLDPKTELADLKRIAGRSGEPGLEFGTDEDNSLGIDPESLQGDLGNDPIAFAKSRIAIARDLIARQEKRALPADQDFAVLRRAVGFAVRDVGRAAGILTRQIGGLRTLRDFPNTGRDPLTPVSAIAQRHALDILATGVLAADAFKLSPALQRKLVPDFNERGDALFTGESPVATDYSIITVIVEMQRALLGQLMGDAISQRILDSVGKTDDARQAFKLSELYDRIGRDVWGELHTGGADIPMARRELQREYVNRMSSVLLRPAALSRADARSLMRAQAQALLPTLLAASKRTGLSAEARAHLADSAESLRQALSAPLQRAGA